MQRCTCCCTLWAAQFLGTPHSALRARRRPLPADAAAVAGLFEPHARWRASVLSVPPAHDRHVPVGRQLAGPAGTAALSGAADARNDARPPTPHPHPHTTHPGPAATATRWSARGACCGERPTRWRGRCGAWTSTPFATACAGTWPPRAWCGSPTPTTCATWRVRRLADLHNTKQRLVCQLSPWPVAPPPAPPFCPRSRAPGPALTPAAPTRCLAGVAGFLVGPDGSVGRHSADRACLQDFRTWFLQ